jgi:hypothetical protein
MLSFSRVESKEVGGNRPRVEGTVLKETPASATLEVKVSAGMMAKTKTLPDGAVGTLVFNISADAEPDMKIPLKTKARAVLGEAAQATPVSVLDPGSITVVPTLIFSCFFYMH